MAEKKGKRPFHNLFPPPPPSKEERQYDEDDGDDDDDDGGEETDDDEEWTDSSFSGDSSDLSEDDGHETDEDNEGDDDDDDDDYDEDDEDDDDDDDDDDESLFNRVIFLLKEGGDLGALNVKECKAYLRKHGLRIAGTKAVCIQRIIEHWRIKDGNGENLYPRSSFIINCTGDVCRGDVVLFTQRVYEKFDKVRRHGRLLGKRTVAGRVVKESYGAAKQQHTFTVEVLWSKGIKKLHPLFPLLVKGRNLYKLKTFRQRWNNEAERRKILAEKHSRGSAARLVRATKKRRKEWSGRENGGTKHQKHVCCAKPHQIRKSIAAENEKHAKINGKANNLYRFGPHVRQMSENPISGTSKATQRHPKQAHVTRAINQTRPYLNPLQNLYGSHRQFNHGKKSFYDGGSTSSSFIPSTHNFFSQSSYNYEVRNLNRIAELATSHRSSDQFPSGREVNGVRKSSF